MDSFSLISSNKGNVVGAIAGGITVIVMIIAAILIVGNVENSTSGQCSITTPTVTNATALTSGGNHTFTLTYPVTATAGTLDVAYVWAAGSCNLTVNGNSITALDGTSPDSITVSGSYLAAATTVEYACSTNNNITAANLTYSSLGTCPYSYDSYNAMANTTDITWSAAMVLGVVILVMFAMIVVAAVMTLGG